jgi:methionine-S-sulfoxide reductase
MDGIIRTRVGYSGGKKKDPTYRRIRDHSETLQIDYDPSRISYDKLLEAFWRNHNPTRRAWSRQYKSAIFYHNEKQYQLALETKNLEEKQRGKKIKTEILPFDKFYLAEILPFDKFYLAEDYHQKYQLRLQKDLMKEYRAMYPRNIDFVNSTSTARVNGYVSGYGTPEEIKANLKSLGLSDEGQKRLLSIFGRWNN